MAGFFGLFNYEKEGPGISKNAPKKKTFIVFFETFFRNFWKFITINLVYGIISLPQITSGLASAGFTHVARNTARDKHSFGLSDFFDTIKKNWKQALGAGIINTLVYAIIIFDLWFFYTSVKGVFGIIGLGLMLSVLVIFTMMNYFIWTLMITFKFKLKQIYKNSFNFAVINLKKNFLCFFVLLLVHAVYVGILFLFQRFWHIVLAFEIFAYILTYPGFKFLLVQYCCFPAIKKYIIDPYYEEHPDEDIEKRRDLGIEVDEPEPVVVGEDGEEESENVFED
ncbi:MAG: DUF624 domain-containing protein [Acutalibacteraceae bacterium]|jgi:uncharacterized membrane protein YesL|nr:DUF624 domain-containing protein [Acutalibacteraceae bacterium]